MDPKGWHPEDASDPNTRQIFLPNNTARVFPNFSAYKTTPTPGILKKYIK